MSGGDSIEVEQARSFWDREYARFQKKWAWQGGAEPQSLRAHEQREILGGLRMPTWPPHPRVEMDPEASHICRFMV